MSTVISFFGADHKCGTTMISSCVAQAIRRKNEDARILIAQACTHNYFPYFQYEGDSFERLSIYLKNMALDVDELLQLSASDEGINLISGRSPVSLSDPCNFEMISFLLNQLKDKFELVIFDAGCEAERPETLGALFCSDRIYGIVSQSEIALRRMNSSKELLAKAEIYPGSYIINKYSRDAALDERYICGRVNKDERKMFSVKLSRYGEQSETDSKTLLSYKDGAFRSDIEKIADDIMDMSGLSVSGRKMFWKNRGLRK